jgi:hypothetical protein
MKKSEQELIQIRENEIDMMIVAFLGELRVFLGEEIAFPYKDLYPPRALRDKDQPSSSGAAWYACMDDKTGSYYYWNSNTNEVILTDVPTSF